MCQLSRRPCRVSKDRRQGPATWGKRAASPGSRVTMCAALVDIAGGATWPALQVSSHDLLMAATCAAGAWAWVRIFEELAKHHLLEQKLSRKIVHITTGLLFYSLWPFFSPAPSARFLAAVTPSANIARLLALGNGLAKDEAAVRSISREGNPKELLRGPLYYVLVITLVTVSFWRTSPVGGIALALMCGGDGIADIVGRRVGGSKLPWNPRKSWAGSLAMFLFGYPLALGAVHLFHVFGFYEVSLWSAAARVAVIAAGATLMESLPITDVLDDNITVPFTCICLGLLLFPPAA